MLQWQTLCELPAFSRSAALVGDTLYVIGPNKRDTVAVDVRSGAVTPIPAGKHHKRTATLAAAGETLLLFGAKGVVQSYDRAARKWSDAGKLRQPMFRTSAAAVGDAVYLVGGRVHSERGARAMREIERFDIATGTSESAGLLPLTLSDCQVAVRPADRTIDIIGGAWVEGSSIVSESKSSPQTQWITFDPATHRMTERDPLPQPVAEGAAVWDGDASLYLVGGAEQQVLVFSPASGQWESERPLPEPGSFAEAFIVDEQLIAVQSGSVHVAQLEARSAPPTNAPSQGMHRRSSLCGRAGEAGPFATLEEAEHAALEFLRAGLSAEIEER